MQRNFGRLNIYLNRLLGDIYAQPPDPGHTRMAQQLVDKWIANIAAKKVLDVGCGQGFMEPMITKLGMKYTGVTLGEDYRICKEKGLDVYEADFTFLPFEDNSFDLIISRHSLEHSPMPVVTLMEWHRIAQWLCLVAPAPEHYGWGGLNHYSVAGHKQITSWLERTEWHIIWEDTLAEEGQIWEHWFMCEKVREEEKAINEN
jgi:SAM-dependent methyltransferase